MTEQAENTAEKDDSGAEQTTEAVQNTESLLDDADGAAAETAAIDFSKGMPENFPKEAWDETAKAPKADILYQKLQDAETRAKGLRDKLARGEGKPPKTAEEYAFKPSEKAAKIFEKDDPLEKAARAVALEAGLTKEQFEKFMGKMSDSIADLADARAKEQPAELTPEQKKEARDAEYKKIGPNAPQVIKAVETWAKELKAQGVLSEDDVKAFKGMALTGDQVRVLNKIRAIAGGGNEIPTDAGDDSLPSDREIAQMLDKASKMNDGGVEYTKIENKYYPLRAAAGRPTRLQI